MNVLVVLIVEAEVRRRSVNEIEVGKCIAGMEESCAGEDSEVLLGEG